MKTPCHGQLQQTENARSNLKTPCHGQQLRPKGPSVDWAPFIWNHRILSRISCFGCLGPFYWGSAFFQMLPLHKNTESEMHIFFQCNFTKVLWVWILKENGFTVPFHTSASSIWNALSVGCDLEGKKGMWQLPFSTLCT